MIILSKNNNSLTNDSTTVGIHEINQTNGLSSSVKRLSIIDRGKVWVRHYFFNLF